MKKPLKQQTKYQVWAWIALSINIAVASVTYACYTSEMNVLIIGILFSLVSVAQGIGLAWRDLDKKSNGVATVIDYICTLALSLFCVYEVAEKTTLAVIWWFLPAFFLEVVGVYLIARKK